jgi:hypothetical protein
MKNSVILLDSHKQTTHYLIKTLFQGDTESPLKKDFIEHSIRFEPVLKELKGVTKQSKHKDMVSFSEKHMDSLMTTDHSKQYVRNKFYCDDYSEKITVYKSELLKVPRQTKYCESSSTPDDEIHAHFCEPIGFAKPSLPGTHGTHGTEDFTRALSSLYHKSSPEKALGDLVSHTQTEARFDDFLSAFTTNKSVGYQISCESYTVILEKTHRLFDFVSSYDIKTIKIFVENHEAFALIHMAPLLLVAVGAPMFYENFVGFHQEGVLTKCLSPSIERRDKRTKSFLYEALFRGEEILKSREVRQVGGGILTLFSGLIAYKAFQVGYTPHQIPGGSCAPKGALNGDNLSSPLPKTISSISASIVYTAGALIGHFCQGVWTGAVNQHDTLVDQVSKRVDVLSGYFKSKK